MADKFNFVWSQIQNYIAEADADLIPVPGQLQVHGRCRYGVLLSPRFSALCVADLIVGMEELNYIADAETDIIYKSNNCR